MAKVLIIPGHGGRDSGTSGKSAANGSLILESKLNLNVSMRLKQKLEEHGVTVVMSRTTDVYISPNDQLKLAKKQKYDAVILVHHNGGKGKGWEVLWNKESDKRLAQFIGSQFNALNKPHGQGVVNSPRQLAFDYCPWPCVYTEFCFLDTLSDIALVDTLEEQWKEANAIAVGILQFLGLM